MFARDFEASGKGPARPVRAFSGGGVFASTREGRACRPRCARRVRSRIGRDWSEATLDDEKPRQSKSTGPDGLLSLCVDTGIPKAAGTESFASRAAMSEWRPPRLAGLVGPHRPRMLAKPVAAPTPRQAITREGPRGERPEPSVYGRRPTRTWWSTASARAKLSAVRRGKTLEVPISICAAPAGA